MRFPERRILRPSLFRREGMRSGSESTFVRLATRDEGRCVAGEFWGENVEERGDGKSAVRSAATLWRLASDSRKMQNEIVGSKEEGRDRELTEHLLLHRRA